MWEVITRASNYWRLSQNCYHTCSDQEGDSPWVRIATKGQGLGLMSCSEDISPIYSCAGCCQPPDAKACSQATHSFILCWGSCSFSSVCTLQVLFWKNLSFSTAIFLGMFQKHTALCSDGGPTAGSGHSQHCSASKVWHIPRPSPRSHSEKAYSFLQTHSVSPAVQGSAGKIPWIQEGVISSDVNSNHTNGKGSTSFAWGIKINKCKGCASPVDICYLFNKRAAGDSWP